MSQSRIHASIKFQAGLGGRQQFRHITKLWNGQSHIDNYFAFVKRNMGWTFDEIFVTPK
mgnify:FL=1